MASLRETLERLREGLPDAEDVDEESIADLGCEIDEMLEFEPIAICDPGAVATLSLQERKYLDALRYAQCIHGLFSAISFDGFLSIFYNSTGKQLDLLRSELAYFNDPLAPIIAKAYEALAPFYRFEPETNVVTRSPDADWYEMVPENVRGLVSGLEQRAEALRDPTYDASFVRYRDAA